MSLTVSQLPNLMRLQDQCLLHLICHLDDYLPETLALLPRHLRHRLLLNLPAADICRLEKTAVSAGIDMECSVWKTLEDERQAREAYNMNYYWRYNLKAPTSYRDIVCGLVVNGFLESAKELLFSARGCLGNCWQGHTRYGTSTGENEAPLVHLTPNRHLSYFSKQCQESDLLEFMVNECEWKPEQLTLDCSKLTHSEVWKETKKGKLLVQEFLREIQALGLVCVSEDATVPFVLEQVLCNPRTAMRRLRLADMSSGAIANAASFFFPASTIRPSNGAVHYHHTTPYSGLSTLEIESYRQAIDDNLQSLIHYQEKLESITLSNFYFCETPSVKLTSTLGTLFHQPQFKRLSLGGGICLTWEHLGALIPEFLAAPSQYGEKVLSLKAIVFRDSGTVPETSHVTRLGKSKSPQKVLSIDFTRKQPRVFSWLSGLCNLSFSG